MKRFAFVMLVISLVATGCMKKSSEVREQFCEEGYISWRGEPAADGLGWVYVRNLDRTQPFVLKGLPEAFKVDSLPVSICLEKTGDLFYCMCAAPMHYYQVNSIQRR